MILVDLMQPEKVIDGLKKNKIKEVKVEGQGSDDWVCPYIRKI